MQAVHTGVIANGTIQLPSDCREVQSLRIASSGYETEINPLSPSRLADAVSRQHTVGYVTVGDDLTIIGSADGSTYTLTYWQQFPDLASSPMNRNWLLQREPGAYLYGALIEASPYLQDDARTLVWVQQYRDIVDGMHAEDDRARYGNAPAIRVSAP